MAAQHQNTREDGKRARSSGMSCAGVMGGRFSVGCLVLAGVFTLMQCFLRASASPVRTGYIVEVWHSERGLPQNTVTGIAQTPDGYLWISTLDGLARFDGANFRMFRAGNTPALGSGRIRFLFRGGGGVLYASTQEGGLVSITGGRFAVVELPVAGAFRSPADQVEEADGALWISMEDGWSGRLKGGVFEMVSTNWATVSPPGYKVRSDAAGRIFATGKSGVYRVQNDKLIPYIEAGPEGIDLACAGRKTGWWIVAGGQASFWDGGRRVRTFDIQGEKDAVLTCAMEDARGNLWLGSAGQGLFRVQANGVVTRLRKTDGLSSDHIRVLCEDNEGNVWVGTEGGGLNRLYRPVFDVYGTGEGLSSERVTAVCASAGGGFWAGTDGYGLNRVEGKEAVLAGENEASKALRVTSVLEDSRKRVWVGLRYGGVMRYESGVFKPFAKALMANRTTRCLFEDRSGNIWVGQYGTTNLICIRGESPRLIPLPPSLPPVDIRVMAEDPEGALWIGTDGAGLLRLKDGRFSRFTRENGLGSDFIWWLHPQDEGLWIGTYGGGLSRLSEGRFVTCTMRDGLVDNVICCIVDDQRGNLWFSSNQGVFRSSRADLNAFADGKLRRIYCVAYGKSDGLPSMECEGGTQSAGCRTMDGRFWFPTIRGLVVLDPATLETNVAGPPVYIEEMVADSQRLYPAAQSAENGGVIELEGGAGQRQVVFRCTALSFSAPESVSFRHKLEGVDAGWVETGRSREAAYDRLAPGMYTFRVQARTRDGVWSPRAAALRFAVLPVYYQTWWFMALVLVFFGLSVGWGVSYALRRRHRRKLELVQKLHALERERTRIARDIHDDLGGSLTEIGYLGALAVRDSGSLAEAREQLSVIIERTRELARRLDETVWAVNPKNDSLPQLASYLCHFAREFLEPTGIRCRLDVQEDLPDLTVSSEVRHNIFLVVKEALNNAVKHSGADQASLAVRCPGQTLVIEIADTGCGFNPGASGGDSGGAGNGLRNMAARMAEIGGGFELIAAPGKGTKISLSLALRRMGDRPESPSNGGCLRPEHKLT